LLKKAEPPLFFQKKINHCEKMSCGPSKVSSGDGSLNGDTDDSHIGVCEDSSGDGGDCGSDGE